MLRRKSLRMARRAWWPLLRLLLFVSALWLTLGWPAWGLGVYWGALIVAAMVASWLGRKLRARRGARAVGR